jgi:hypothetical protein
MRTVCWIAVPGAHAIHVPAACSWRLDRSGVDLGARRRVSRCERVHIHRAADGTRCSCNGGSSRTAFCFHTDLRNKRADAQLATVARSWRATAGCCTASRFSDVIPATHRSSTDLSSGHGGRCSHGWSGAGTAHRPHQQGLTTRDRNSAWRADARSGLAAGATWRAVLKVVKALGQRAFEARWSPSDDRLRRPARFPDFVTG